MSTPDSPIPPQLITGISQSIEKLARSNQNVVLATLTAAIINARGKPTSINEVLAISRDIGFAMQPAPNYGVYQEWAKTKDQALAKIYD